MSKSYPIVLFPFLQITRNHIADSYVLVVDQEEKIAIKSPTKH